MYVRPAQRADLLAVYRIETASFPQPWPFAAFEQYVGEPGFLVATDGDAVLGYLVADTVSNRDLQIGHIKNLAVHREHRGRGIGSLLLRHAIRGFEEIQVPLVKLEVRRHNDAALDLYRSHDFEQRTTVEGYYEDGEDALLLVRDL